MSTARLGTPEPHLLQLHVPLLDLSSQQIQALAKQFESIVGWQASHTTQIACTISCSPTSNLLRTKNAVKRILQKAAIQVPTIEVSTIWRFKITLLSGWGKQDSLNKATRAIRIMSDVVTATNDFALQLIVVTTNGRPNEALLQRVENIVSAR